MVIEIMEMFCLVFDVFVSMDIKFVVQVIFFDDFVDEKNWLIIQEFQELMKENFEFVEFVLYCFFGICYIECIGDLVENIVEDVMYIVNGIIVCYLN